MRRQQLCGGRGPKNGGFLRAFAHKKTAMFYHDCIRGGLFICMYGIISENEGGQY